MKIELHPLCALFPPASDTDFEALLRDIEKNGLREPIHTYQGKILDGQNRLKACRILNITPTFSEYESNNVIEFVISKNLSRRHLNDSQKAAIIAALTNYDFAYKNGGDRITQNNKVVLNSITDRAKISGASREIQRKADYVAKIDKSLISEVSKGLIPLSTAYNSVKNANSTHISTKQAENIKSANLESPKKRLNNKIESMQKLISKLYAENKELRIQLSDLCETFGIIRGRNWHKKKC